MKLRATGFEMAPPDTNECRRALAVLIGPGAIFELRALPAGRSAICRSADDAIVAIREFAHAAGVYYTLNPLRADMEGRAARNGDVLVRCWLLVDVDPIRPADLSSSDDEKSHAARVACAIVDDLAARGWPAPVMVDSGNGFHLLYRVDLPNTKLAQQWVKRVLVVLAGRHDTDSAHVDRSVHNASRIAKLPGTWARKGPDTPDRPHRMARLAMVPEKVGVVSLDQIKDLIGPDDPADGPSSDPGPSGDHGPFRMRVSAGSKDAYCRAAIQGECARVALAPDHDRNNQLNRSAFALGGLLHLECFSRADAEAQLAHAARRAGLGDREIAATIRSGLDAGVMEPRKLPDGVRDGKAKAQESSNPTVLPDEDSTPFTGRSGRSYKFPLVVRGENVTPKRVRWLWPDRIPCGFLTLMAGRTGVGKSFVTLDIAARLSVGGEIPLGEGECFAPGRCLIISEDTHEYILAPRLIEAGADMRRVRFMSWMAMAAFTLSDIEMIDDAYYAADEPNLVVIDPPTNFLGAKDEHRNAEVRGVLMGMSIWAMRHDLACVLITHCNKGIKKDMAAIDRVIGSVAWASTSRIAHLFAKHPDEADQGVFLPLKSNIGKTADGIAYRIESADITARVAWVGPVDFSADDAIGLDAKRIPRGVAAVDWLADRFRERTTWPSDELRTAAIEAGLSKNALWTHEVKSLPIRKRHVCPPDAKSYWVWELIPDRGWPPELDEVPDSNSNGNLGNVGTLPRKSKQDNTHGRFPIQKEGGNLKGSQDSHIPRFPTDVGRNERPTRAHDSGDRNTEETDAVPSSPLDRDRFRVGAWLREYLSGRPNHEGGVLAAGQFSGHSEADLRAAADLIGVDISDEDGLKIWRYKE